MSQIIFGDGRKCCYNERIGPMLGWNTSNGKETVIDLFQGIKGIRYLVRKTCDM